MQVKPYETTMTDTKPFNHGEEGTHSVCNKHNIGGKSICCKCSGEVGCGESRNLWEDQKAWNEAHKHADELVYKNNAIYSAIYYPPIRFMERATTVIADSIHQAVAEERERVRGEIEATPATLNVENNNSQQIYENWGRQAMKKQILSALDKPLTEKESE